MKRADRRTTTHKLSVLHLIGLLSVLMSFSLNADDSLMSPLVTTAWLEQHLTDPDLVVLDCTVLVRRNEDGTMSNINGRASYESGHIPTAGFADLMGDLSSTEYDRDFMAPSVADFALRMGELGVGDDTRVVLYDSYNSVWAARVWWMLRWAGFDNVAILDGGLRAWKAEGRALSTDPSDEPTRTLTPDPRNDLFVDKEAVIAAIDDESIRIIDSLPSQHYSGEMAMYARPGHIETAENRSTMLLIDETGRFRSQADLGDMFPGDQKQQAITYCGGGIAASAVAFTMHRLGFEDVRVYDASLEEWAADASLPMEVSPDFDWSED
jgi:thiosulfate/3-mercaptopyruvate sulfurtransferase